MPDDPNTVRVGNLAPSDFYVEAGNTGLKVFGGYVVEEFEPNLRGLRGARMMREMWDTDPTIGAIIFVISQAIRKVQWHLSPADQSLPSLLAQEFFEGTMADMDHTWDDFISEVMSMFVWGYAPFEIVLKIRQGADAKDPRYRSRFDDGMIGVRKLAMRSQETILRWIMDADNNDILGVVQIPWTGGIRTIPAEKMLLFRTISFRNNPEGRSLMRNAYRPYYFRKRMEEIEAIGIERDLAGLPVLKIPAELIAAANSGSDPKASATLAAYKNMIINIRRNTQEGVVLPGDTDQHGKPLFDLTLLHSGGQRQFDTSVIINRYTQLIATTVMADFLLLGHTSRGGSQALGTSKVDMFYSAIEGMVQNIVSVLNSQLVPLLGTLNGIPSKNWPQFYADKAEQIDLGKLGAFINALAASGMQLFPNPNLEEYLYQVAGLPEPDDETQQMQSQTNALEHAGKINALTQALQPAAPLEEVTPAPKGGNLDAGAQQPPGQAGGGKQPPQKMGGGGGNPQAPQGQFGPPRGKGPPKAPGPRVHLISSGFGGGGMNKRRFPSLFEYRRAA
jgi:hypothetical protein